MRASSFCYGKGEQMALRTNYKDDVFTGKRKYTEIDNGDGTISFNDETEYTQTGDTYGAAQINETNDVVNNLDSKSYKSADAAETSIADNDYFPFYDTSATKQKKTLFSNLKNVLTNVFAIKTHSSSSTTYGTGSSSLYGHVKLSDNYTSSAGPADSGVGASSKAVFDAFTTNKNSITSVSGSVSSLSTQVNTNKNNISNLNTIMGTAEGNITNLSTRAGNLETRAGNLESRAGTLENELTANGNRIYMDFKNGKYGYNTSAGRGADTFHPFKGDMSIYLPTSLIARFWGDGGWGTAEISFVAPSDGSITFTNMTISALQSSGSYELSSVTALLNINGASAINYRNNSDARTYTINQTVSFTEGQTLYFLCQLAVDNGGDVEPLATLHWTWNLS